MTDKTKKLVNVFLYSLFTLTISIFMLSVVADQLLISKTYKRALSESDFYERIYIDYLGDPETQKSFDELMKGTKLEPVSDKLLSISTSTLYLLLPPDRIQVFTERLLDESFGYLRGDTQEIDVRSTLVHDYDSVLSDTNRENLKAVFVRIDDFTVELEETLSTMRSYTILVHQVLLPLSLLLYVLSASILIVINKGEQHKVAHNIGGLLTFVGLMTMFLGFIVWSKSDISRIEVGESMLLDTFIVIVASVLKEIFALSFVTTLIGIGLFTITIPNIGAKATKYYTQNQSGLKNLGFGLLTIFIVLLTVRFIYKLNEPTKCNGYEELCDRPVNEVAFPTTHNSMSIAEYRWLWPSHDGTIMDQLEYGIRGFLIDTHYYDTTASIASYFPDATEEEIAQLDAIINKVGLKTFPGTYLCHMACVLGDSSLEDTLSSVKLFLDEYPNEVLVFIIEDKITSEDTELAFEKSKLDRYIYSHNQNDDWPTLRELIEIDKRVIVMAEVEGPDPEWYKNAWDYTEETPYAFHDVNSLQAKDSCQPNRGETGKDFFLMNHWIERVSPSRVDSSIVNDYDFLLERAQRCKQERGKIPNFVAVNFYQNGDLIKVVEMLNGVGEGQ